MKTKTNITKILVAVLLVISLVVLITIQNSYAEPTKKLDINDYSILQYIFKQPLYRPKTFDKDKLYSLLNEYNKNPYPNLSIEIKEDSIRPVRLHFKPNIEFSDETKNILNEYAPIDNISIIRVPSFITSDNDIKTELKTDPNDTTIQTIDKTTLNENITNIFKQEHFNVQNMVNLKQIIQKVENELVRVGLTDYKVDRLEYGIIKDIYVDNNYDGEPDNIPDPLKIYEDDNGVDPEYFTKNDYPYLYRKDLLNKSYKINWCKLDQPIRIGISKYNSSLERKDYRVKVYLDEKEIFNKFMKLPEEYFEDAMTISLRLNSYINSMYYINKLMDNINLENIIDTNINEFAHAKITLEADNKNTLELHYYTNKSSNAVIHVIFKDNEEVIIKPVDKKYFGVEIYLIGKSASGIGKRYIYNEDIFDIDKSDLQKSNKKLLKAMSYENSLSYELKALGKSEQDLDKTYTNNRLDKQYKSDDEFHLYYKIDKNKPVKYKVKKPKVVQNITKTHTGNPINIVPEAVPDTDLSKPDLHFTVTGNIQTNVGDYTAVVTLDQNYEWEDGTKEPLHINWKIVKQPTPSTPPQPAPKTEHVITIHGGTSNLNKALEGNLIKVSATETQNKIFEKWDIIQPEASKIRILPNLKTKNIEFTMPNCNVELMARFKNEDIVKRIKVPKYKEIIKEYTGNNIDVTNEILNNTIPKGFTIKGTVKKEVGHYTAVLHLQDGYEWDIPDPSKRRQDIQITWEIRQTPTPHKNQHTGGSTGSGGSGGTGRGGSYHGENPPSIKSQQANTEPLKGRKRIKFKKAPYVIGTGKGMFSPNKHLTKAEAIQMVINILEIPEDHEEPTKSYKGKWYSKTINLAKNIGILKDDSNLDKPLTRESFINIIAELEKIMTGKEELKPNTTHFKDTDSNTVNYFYEKKIISGKEANLFMPNDNLTRAESVEILNKLQERQLEGTVKQLYKDTPPTHWAFTEIYKASTEQETKQS